MRRSGCNPFYIDGNFGAAGGAEGSHVVCITDYDATSQTALVDNQWGTSGDHRSGRPVQISERRFELAGELYKAHVFNSKEFENTLIHADVKSELNHKHDKPTDRIALLRYLTEQRKLDGALSELSQKRRQAVTEAIKKGSN